MKLNRSELHQLEASINAACKTKSARRYLRMKIAIAVLACESTLKPKKHEQIHWFFSPHRGPSYGRNGQVVCPRAFSLVRVRRGAKYDQGVVKAVPWITTNGSIDGPFIGMQYRIFFDTDGYMEIADDVPIDFMELAEKVRDHMRHGKKLEALYDLSRELVQSQIFPLLKKPKTRYQKVLEKCVRTHTPLRTQFKGGKESLLD